MFMISEEMGCTADVVVKGIKKNIGYGFREFMEI